MTRSWFKLLAGVAVPIAAPATAKPVGFALIDIEGAEADQLARLPQAEAAAYVATLVARRPAAIIVNTVLDSTPDEKEVRFVTPPPKGIIPRKGVPASVYIVSHQYDGIAIWGRLEYRDFTRKTPSPTPPADRLLSCRQTPVNGCPANDCRIKGFCSVEGLCCDQADQESLSGTRPARGR